MSRGDFHKEPPREINQPKRQARLMHPDIAKHPEIAGASPQVDPSPEFIRLPKSPHRCPFSGLSRSALNDLILGTNPPVRSVVVRKRGAVRGIRLIDYASLVRYLHQLGERDATEATGE